MAASALHIFHNRHSAFGIRQFFFLCLCVSVFIGALGCGHKRARVPVPPPPPPATVETPAETATTQPPFEPDVKPLFVQLGKASWYGAPFHNRKAANGETYDMNALTAAHLTLPLNSIVRVTNMKSGQSVTVRITDRGPFVEDRIIDLSAAAAKSIDVWRRGIALVKLEVLQAPATIRTGGRWAVQLGGFPEEEEARRIQSTLARRYHTAKVLAFSSPVGDWWVRVRVLDDDRRRAQEVADSSPAAHDHTFLVRLD
jgi:rare lipoprotein A